MYCKYYDNEESFLSVYTAKKLKCGGEPKITKEELQKTLQKFVKSVYYMDNLDEIKKFKFDDLEGLAKAFQKRASENRSWLKPCFIYENETLRPTYNFYDFTSTNYGEFLSFLHDERYKIFTPSAPSVEVKKFDANTKKAAKLGAKYITEYFAKKYIESEEEEGRWPCHLTKLSSIFKDDLGRALKLIGTKAYFSEFKGHVYSSLCNMLSQNDGQLKLSDQKDGTLKYNNLKRILVPYPAFDELCSEYYSDSSDPKKFEMEIDKTTIKVNEKKLVYSDPYGDFSDDYKNTEIDLTKSSIKQEQQ